MQAAYPAALGGERGPAGGRLGGGFTGVGVLQDLAAVTGLAANGILLAYALLIAAGCWLWLWRFSTHRR